jgi:GT2 family glycosyltransferase
VIDLSIVVLNWNGRALLLDCLRSLEREVRSRRDAGRLDTEVLVVDQAYSDGSVQAVAAEFPAAELVALPANLGFAAGNNAGLRRARGRYVALLNNDTQVLPDALERCVRHLDAHPEVGLVGPQLLNPDGSKQNSVHNVPGLLTEVVPRGVLETLFPRRFPSKRYEHAGPLEGEGVLGACMVVRREVLERVGPLPEDYFFFLEETDWCWRIRRAGWRIHHLPDARVIHAHSAAAKRLPAETRSITARSATSSGSHGVRSAPLRRSAWRRACSTRRPVGGTRLEAAARALAPGLRVLAWHLRGRPAGEGLVRLRGAPAAGVR